MIDRPPRTEADMTRLGYIVALVLLVIVAIFGGADRP